MATTAAHDLLPQWLVHHDTLCDASTSTSSCPSNSSASSIVKSAVNSSSSNIDIIADAVPPSHITMVPWDDGFTPSGCSGKPCKMIRDQQRSSPNVMCVFDDAVSCATADALYASAVRTKVWGVYVPTAELDLSHVGVSRSDSESLATSSNADNAARCSDATNNSAVETEDDRRTLARRAVQELLVGCASRPQSPTATTADKSVISAADWAATHGVAVWVIASDCDDETSYHLDYAELVRFETNVIVPPLYGATLHVSPLRDRDVAVQYNGADASAELPALEGGAFFAHRDGLDHYKRVGYKTRLLASPHSTDALEAASSIDTGWTRVPYLHRRGIVCDGELPHFSSRVRALPTAASVAAARAHLTGCGRSSTNGETASDANSALPAVKRVVVGFNLFGHDVGAFVERFPEHSAAFNRHVKLSQAAAKQIAAASDGSSGSRPELAPAAVAAATQPWSLASVRANPKQAAFLRLLAAKARAKGVDIATLRRGSSNASTTSNAAPCATASAAAAAAAASVS